MFIASQDYVGAKCSPSALECRPHVLYLHERDGWFYFKRKIPVAIQWAFGGVKQVWKSLETSKFDEAVEALTASLKVFDAEAENARKTKSAAAARREQVRKRGTGTTKYLLDAHIEPLLERFEHAHLITDDDERCGLTRPELIERGSELGAALAQMLEQAATETYSGYEEVAQELLTGEQLLAPPGSDIRHTLLQRLLQRDIRIVEIQLERLRGKVTPTTKAEPPPPRHLMSMLDIFQSWSATQTSPRTIDTYRGFVAEFEHVAGALPCVAVGLDDVEVFCGRLEARGCSRETVENYIGGLATLLRHGISKGLMPLATANPFEVCNLDHIVKRPMSEDRRAYEITELNIFFQSRLYTSDFRPEGQVAEASHWGPLTAAFTGGRIEEISQARTEDILLINGVWAFRIAELDKDQGIKTDGSWRYIPIHAELIRCGFLAYVASVRLAGHRQLFPSLRNKNKYKLWSNALSKWFSRYLDSIGLQDDRLCFHSFRFSFRQWCTHSGISDEARDALTGHWVSKSTSGRGYMRVAERQYSFPLLVKAMEAFRYGELDLSHLYVTDPMKGVEDAFGPAIALVNVPRPVKRTRAPVSHHWSPEAPLYPFDTPYGNC